MDDEAFEPEDPDWRQFERLVALIESEAGPRGAKVVSPDRIRDIDTGQLREVDASIRFRAGTVDILITIECRKRGRKADDTWIEQLATKRQKIGAAKTIAVTSAGFTESATTSASRYGIELRQLEAIQPEDIDQWFLPHGIVHIFREVEDMECKVELASGTTEHVDVMKPMFRHTLVNSFFPAAAFLNFIEMKEPRHFWAVPLDGTKVRLVFELDGQAPDLIPVPPGVSPPLTASLKLKHEHGTFKVKKLSIGILFSYQAVPFDRGEGKHHIYRDMHGQAIQHSSFKGRVFDLPVQFDHQSNPDGTHSATVKFPSGPRLPSQWAGFVKHADEDAQPGSQEGLR